MEAAAGKAAAAAGESSAAKKEPPVDVCAPQVFLLTGGGSGVGKAHFRNSEAVYVERHPKKALNWGELIFWNRAYLRRIDAKGGVADSPPSAEELAQLPMVMKQPDLQFPATLPPQPPPLRGSMAKSRCVVVLFDLELYGWRGADSLGGIGEVAASALVRGGDGAWGVPPQPVGRFARTDLGALPRQGMSDFLRWIQALAEATGGAVVMLAHNGISYDWPIVLKHLQQYDLSMPSCVEALGDSKYLLLAEKAPALLSKTGRQRWSMHNIYLERFGEGAMVNGKLPYAHQAAGDVFAMERIFHDACMTNGPEHMENLARSCAAQSVQFDRAVPPTTSTDVKVITSLRSASALPSNAARSASPLLDDDDPLQGAEAESLLRILNTIAHTPVMDRGSLAAVLRSILALPPAIQKAAPALERAVRKDRSRVPIAVARFAVGLLVRALSRRKKAAATSD